MYIKNTNFTEIKKIFIGFTQVCHLAPKETAEHFLCLWDQFVDLSCVESESPWESTVRLGLG
jgi:hypothetical protein